MDNIASKKKQRTADTALLIVALSWGFSYYFLDICMTDGMEPMFLNGIRFMIAFAAVFLVTFKHCVRINRATLAYSAILGGVLMPVYVLSTYGLKYTSQSNAGFLCALAVLITPLLDWIFKKKRPAIKLLFVVLIALSGIALMTLTGDIRLAVGDILCLGCSVLYAGHLVITEHAVARDDVDPYTLGVFQLGFAGVLFLAFGFAVETPVLPKTPASWASLVLLAVLCTGAAFVVQSVAQKYTSASNTGVILASEPVFTAIVAYLLAHEVLALRSYIGMALLMTAILIMELPVERWHKALRQRIAHPRGRS